MQRGQLYLGNIIDDTHYLAIIHKPKIFMKRLERFLRINNLDYIKGPIKYFDIDKNQGALNQFSKRIQYEEQNEYRIYIKRKSKRPLIFEIGELSDICIVIRAELNRKINYCVSDEGK